MPAKHSDSTLTPLLYRPCNKASSPMKMGDGTEPWSPCLPDPAQAQSRPWFPRITAEAVLSLSDPERASEGHVPAVARSLVYTPGRMIPRPFLVTFFSPFRPSFSFYSLVTLGVSCVTEVSPYLFFLSSLLGSSLTSSSLPPLRNERSIDLSALLPVAIASSPDDIKHSRF